MTPMQVTVAVSIYTALCAMKGSVEVIAQTLERLHIGCSADCYSVSYELDRITRTLEQGLNLNDG